MKALNYFYLCTMLIMSCIFTSTTSAQSTDAWIDFTKTYYKVKIHKTGLYRIPYTALTATTLSLTGSHFRLYKNGQEIPIYVTTDNTFSNNDYIEFFGEKNNGNFDTQLYIYPQWQPNPDRSLFTDSTTYFLTTIPDQPNKRYTTTNNNISNPPAKETHFWHTNPINISLSAYYEGLPASISGIYRNLSDFEAGEGYVSTDINIGQNADFNFPTPDIYTNTTDSARVYTKIIGRSNVLGTLIDHHVKIKLNNTIYIDTTFEGYQLNQHQFKVPINTLTPPNSVLNVESVNMPNVEQNKNCLAYATITYPHNYNFSNTKAFLFEIDNNTEKYIEMSSFNAGSNPIVYDLTNQLRLTPTLEAGLIKFLLPPASTTATKRKIYVINTDNICDYGTISPVCNQNMYNLPQLQTTHFTDYSLTQNQGNYLILTHPSLRSGDIDQVQRYSDYRASTAGGNHQTLIVNTEELYDQFSYGIRKHPLAVRNFINHCFQTWTTDPDYLLLLGKGIAYKDFGITDIYERCLVPTYGNVASDEMLATSTNITYVPQLAVGRVPARSSEQVRIYLDKLMLYEDQYQNAPCTREARTWMKDALHIAGGYNLSESNEFISTLNAYKNIYEDTLMGGNVIHTYNRISEQVIEDEDLHEYINPGLNLITFFGHSSGELLNVNLNNPYQYSNYGKFPFFITGSCSVGDIHDGRPEITTLPEDYVFADNLGSIGFLGTASLGFPTYLYAYLSRFYNNFCDDNYTDGIGKSIQQTISEISLQYLNDKGAKITAQEYTLTGDPALRLRTFDLPEYIIENNTNRTDISLFPQNLTTDLDSFLVKINVSNLGKAVNDSFSLQIKRTLPDGTQQTYQRHIPATVYNDTLQIYITTGDPAIAAGENRLLITIDANNEIAESCEDNNQAELTFYIFADLLIPIAPCNFSIVTQNPPITLYASTGQPHLTPLDYVFQIDTTEAFNSPALKTHQQNSIGGVLTWQPDINYQPNKVYYWRTARKAAVGEAERWKNTSFIYLPTSSEGWNQSHYYQYNYNNYNNTEINPITRQFQYVTDTNTLYLHNPRQTGAVTNLQFLLNNQVLQQNTCLQNSCTNGIAFAIMPPNFPLTPWTSQNINQQFGCNGLGQYNNIHCDFSTKYVFEFPNETPEHWNNINNFIQNIVPNDYYVLVYSVKNHRFDSPNSDILEQFFTQMGINNLNNLDTSKAFVAFGIKNKPNSGQATISATPEAPTTLNITPITTANNGNFKTPLIGPATQWQTVEWQTIPHENPSADEQTVQVFGIQNNQETLLFTTNNSPIDISSIAANQYRFIRLQLNTKDTINNTPPQLQHWRVLFHRAPEMAINLTNQFVFYNDTLNQGEDLSLLYSITNPEIHATDSVNIHYQITTENGQVYQLTPPALPPINPQSTTTAQFSYSTDNMIGHNILAVVINPNDEQIEKFKFNNVMYLPFFVTTDKINPNIDVTFDGRHIIDGELIAAKPTINIRIKDDNRNLELNDTSDYRLFLVNKDSLNLWSIEQRIYFNNPNITFTPATDQAATNNNNIATISYRPTLPDGTHVLKVEAKDRSNNNFANDAYRISFTVDNRPAISNLLNYPNPFTTSTRFVFTLTGAEVPQDLRIQIMTVSGKVVREISTTELGNIHIGKNITEFAWDGTDQYGNKLGNGLYLYKVTNHLNGQTLQHYDTPADRFFENNLGKMYLMR
ncbi:MAG: hypothetical protein JNM36_19880 [Chitinophagales bacterium]|nr:hypothetical protein [Chitinophagales bacterium]